MAKKSKYYVVWKGRQTGVFPTWEECSNQVTAYTGAKYKSFDTLEAAQRAFAGDYEEYKGKDVSTLEQGRLIEAGNIVVPSYTVDAACSGNPGPVEYRCVDTQTREEIFRQGPFDNGSNNIGEFLAIVHALALFKKRNITAPVYSDSKHAIKWVWEKKCNTNLQHDASNGELFTLIERAEKWLRENEYSNHVLKWDTEAWGENPADFGRK